MADYRNAGGEEGAEGAVVATTAGPFKARFIVPAAYVVAVGAAHGTVLFGSVSLGSVAGQVYVVFPERVASLSAIACVDAAVAPKIVDLIM